METYLKRNFKDINIRLISGDNGIFDVKVNNNLVFSKKVSRRFPDHSEISDLIEQEIK